MDKPGPESGPPPAIDKIPEIPKQITYEQFHGLPLSILLQILRQKLKRKAEAYSRPAAQHTYPTGISNTLRESLDVYPRDDRFICIIRFYNLEQSRITNRWGVAIDNRDPFTVKKSTEFADDLFGDIDELPIPDEEDIKGVKDHLIKVFRQEGLISDSHATQTVSVRDGLL